MTASHMIVISTLLMGLAAIATPYCFNYSLMMVNRLVTGIFPGIVEPLIYSHQLQIWGEEGKSVTQLVFLSGQLGHVMSPIVTEPFLAVKKNKGDNHGHFNNTGNEEDHQVIYHNNSQAMATQSMDDVMINSSLALEVNFDFKLENATESVYGHLNTGYLNTSQETDVANTNQETDVVNTNHETDVVYAFFITGGLSILTAIVFYLYTRVHSNQYASELESTQGRKQSKASSVNSTELYRSLPLMTTLFLVMGLSLVAMFCAVLRWTFTSFLMTFLLEQFQHVTKSQAAYSLTLSSTIGMASRALLIIIVDRISIKKVLIIYVVVMVFSYASFIIASSFHQITIVMILIGTTSASVSPFFSLCLSWCQEEYLQVTNQISSCLLFAMGLGIMLNPLLVAHLMAEKSNMWFCYIHSIETLIVAAIFFSLLIINGCYIDRKYGPLKKIAQSGVTDDMNANHC